MPDRGPQLSDGLNILSLIAHVTLRNWIRSSSYLVASINREVRTHAAKSQHERREKIATSADPYFRVLVRRKYS